MSSTTAVGASHAGFCVTEATRRPVVRELSAAAAFLTDVERVESLAFSTTSPPVAFAFRAAGSPVARFFAIGSLAFAAGSDAASGSSSAGFAVASVDFAVAVAFAFDADRLDGFFLLLAMKRCSLDAAVRAACRAGPQARALA